MRTQLAAPVLAVILVAGAVALRSQQPAPRPAGGAAFPQPGPALVPLDESWLQWPLPASEKPYASIDGRRLKTYVEELAAISRRSRDRGEQWWGRIQGMPADRETESWLLEKYRKAGVADVRAQVFDLPPQYYPTSWSVSASGGGRTVKLESSVPGIGSMASAPIDVEAVYVGLGTEADFAGRDVRGRAAFIYGSYEPGLWSSSAIHDGGLQRAEQRGAAAVFIAVGLPGNMKMHAVRGRVGIPAFSIGLDDLVAVRQMIEAAAPGKPPRITINLDATMVRGLKTSMVWAVIPGMTDERVIVNGHRDGYFEAAADNASGVATTIGLAEYFAKQPRERRRRTIVLVNSPGHHGTTDLGLKWIQDNKNGELGGSVVLFMNGEHTAAGQTYLRGPVIRKANAPNALWWSLEGSRKLQDIVLGAYRTFGVATYAEPEEGSPPGANGDYGNAATIGLVDAGIFYHTEGETADTVPFVGLEESTRAFAKIIDETSRVDRKDLVKAVPASQSTAKR
jgi:hypothetical protein